MRFLLESLAGLVGGLIGWFAVGMLAGAVLRSMHGDRDGGASMGGFFVIGPVGGVAGFALAFWLARRALERGSAASAASGLGLGLLSLVLVVGAGWGLLMAVAAARRPQQAVDLAEGERGAIEFRIEVPERALRGRPVGQVVSLAYKVYDNRGDSVTPVAWSESRAGGRVVLTGSVPVERRPRESYLSLTQEGETFDLYARIPPDMRKPGRWDDTIWLGSDPAKPMDERTTFTHRYVPMKR